LNFQLSPIFHFFIWKKANVAKFLTVRKWQAAAAGPLVRWLARGPKKKMQISKDSTPPQVPDRTYNIAGLLPPPPLIPALIHCCQIPPGILGQFSQNNSAAGEKIRQQAGHPPNHQKKCSKKFLQQIFGTIFANY
jgi:hypothetical protein